VNIILKIKVSTKRFKPADKPIVAPPYYALCQLKAVFPIPHPPVSPPIRYLVCGARHRDPLQKAPRLGANLIRLLSVSLRSRRGNEGSGQGNEADSRITRPICEALQEAEETLTTGQTIHPSLQGRYDRGMVG